MTTRAQAKRFLWMLSDEHSDKVMDCATEKTFKSGDWIIKTDDEAKSFFLILSGHVALDIDLPNEGPKRIITLSQGDLLGLSWMVAPFKWQFSGQAQEDVEALEVDAVKIRQLCESNHEFGYQLMSNMLRMMGERITATRMQLLDIYGKTGG